MNKLLQSTTHIKPYYCIEILGKYTESLTAKFSPCGEYLAIGCGNGQILIYSFLAHNTILKYSPPKSTGKVLDLSWQGNMIYSITDANLLFRWDIHENKLIEEPVKFDFKTSGLNIHPGNSELILVYGKADVVLLNIATGQKISLKQDEDAVEWFGFFCKEERVILFATAINCFYVLDMQGQVINTQNESENFQSAVKSLHFDGDCLFMLNCRDRCLRLFRFQRETQSFSQVKEISDYVERKRWSACCFFKAPNIDTQFILGCLQEAGSHNIKMFDTVENETRISLSRNMHSPLGAANYLCYSNNTHLYPIISVVTQAGAVLLWASGTFIKTEKWSTSLAIPNFEQLEDGSIEYEEAEDEFDKILNERQSLDMTQPEPVLPFKIDL